MKNLLLKTGILGLAVAASMGVANATCIQGVVTFGGVALLDNANSALATQVSIFLPTVVGVAGDFTPPILVGQTPSITSPLQLGVNPGQVWSLGGFIFTAGGNMVGGGGPNNTFSIGVAGTVDDGPGGFDPTPAVFAMATTPTIGGLGAFASISATLPCREVPPNVPDTGSTVGLLGLGLTGLSLIRRKLTA